MKHPSPIILASQSAARKALLGGAGLVFETCSADVDEGVIREKHLSRGDTPQKIAGVLAEAKALKVSAEYPDAYVIGADQILEFKGKIFEKPDNYDTARNHLKILRGQNHFLHSAISVVKNNQVLWSCVDQAKMSMHAFNDEFLDDYLKSADPEILKCVGCYQLEGLGAQLFEKIDGDYFVILGLPLLALLEFLRKLPPVQ